MTVQTLFPSHPDLFICDTSINSLDAFKIVGECSDLVYKANTQVHGATVQQYV